MQTDDARAAARWRLVLGRFAEERLPIGPGDGTYGRMDRMLDYLYGREYAGRGVRAPGGRPGGASRAGTFDPSRLSVPEWIREVRELFPQETCEVITRHALDRYGMTELVTDPQTLRRLEPNYDLLKALLTFRGLMKGEVLDLARRIIRDVVEDLRRRLTTEVRQALWGRLNRRRRSRFKSAPNLDVRRTIRANLKNYDVRRKRLVVQDLHFFSRVERHLPWHIIMAVDCSGSMIDSVIHSAVMAGIFKGLPSLRLRLVAFDTSVVDLTESAGDPTEVLMSVQLGGGTNIGGALEYCASLVDQPTRTILVVVTDFCEGGSIAPMLATIKRLRGEGVRVLGLAALDADARPSYDRATAEACVEAGAEVAALTPKRLAEWLSQAIS
jgi:Mg-chelatase subunit ChlD